MGLGAPNNEGKEMRKWLFNEGGIIFIVIAFVIAILDHAKEKIKAEQAAQEKRDAWAMKCIDVDGVPVFVVAYTKSLGHGYVCVKANEKIEVK